MPGEVGEGSGGAASQQAVTPARTEISTVTPKTPETPKSPFEISREKPPATGENATGAGPANDILNSASNGGIENTFNKLATDGDLGDKTLSKDQAGMKNYRGMFKEDDNETTAESVKADTKAPESKATASQDPKVQSAYREQMATVHIDDDIPTGTNTGQKNESADQPSNNTVPNEGKQTTEEDYSFKSPGDLANETQNQKDTPETPTVTPTAEQKAETPAPSEQATENKKSEAEEAKVEKIGQQEAIVKMAEITSEIKNLNPDFDPKSPEGQKFLATLAENPGQMNTISDTLKVIGEQKAALENSDLLKNLGINPKDLLKIVAGNLIGTMTQALEKKIQEQAPNPAPEKQEENKKDSMLLSLLKALGMIIIVGGVVAGKKILGQ